MSLPVSSRPCRELKCIACVDSMTKVLLTADPKPGTGQNFHLLVRPVEEVAATQFDQTLYSTKLNRCNTHHHSGKKCSISEYDFSVTELDLPFDIVGPRKRHKTNELKSAETRKRPRRGTYYLIILVD